MFLELYVDEPLVQQNVFIGREPKTLPLPTFEESSSKLPQPHWPANPSAIACYWKTWELAWKNLRAPMPGSGFVSNFIDTAFNDCLFMWDSAFIVQFGRYGERAFSFQKTMDNLYACQHSDGYICREIREGDGSDQWTRYCPFGTGPNVLAWTEWEYFQNFGNLDRLGEVFYPLLAYHRWMRRHQSWPDGSYWINGLGCGMDNMPRVPAGYDSGQDHAFMTWVDATFQALLSANLLVRMGDLLGIGGLEEERSEAERLKTFANQFLWDEEEGFYFDRLRDGSLMKSKSVAGYWGLIAGVVPPERLSRFVSHLDDPKSFKRHHRVPSLAADAPGYHGETGDYWRGGVWAPTNYMVLRGLTANGFDDLAYEIAENHHNRVVEVFEKTGTVWENYAPESSSQGQPAKAHFVGWTGLPPIAVLLEYRFGLRPIDPLKKRLLWDIRLLDEHGVDNYPLGPTASLNLHCEQRSSPTEEPSVTIMASEPVEVEVRWKGGSKLVKA